MNVVLYIQRKKGQSQKISLVLYKEKEFIDINILFSNTNFVLYNYLLLYN